MLLNTNVLASGGLLFLVSAEKEKTVLQNLFNEEILEFALSGAFALLMTAGMLRVLLESAV